MKETPDRNKHVCPPRPFGVYTFGLDRGQHQPGCPEGDPSGPASSRSDDIAMRKMLLDEKAIGQIGGAMTSR
jgi:hypothetical protein